MKAGGKAARAPARIASAKFHGTRRWRWWRHELKRVREASGAELIFGGSYGWSSAGRVHHARTLTRRFLFLGGGCVDQLGNYSWGAAQFFLPHVIGTFSPVNGEVTDWSSIVKHTRLIVAFGGLALKNGQVTSGGAGTHVMEQWLRRAKDAGIAFVVVSPNRGDVPDFLGAQWVPIRPNTDTAMMLAMAHTLLAEQRHDAAFLQRYCTGFEAFSRYLMGADDGVPKTPEWAQAICGVPAATIRDLARRMAATRSLITCAWSLQRAHQRRAAVLGGDHACGHAGRHRASGRRLCLRPWFDQRGRRAARRRARSGISAAA